MPGIRHLRQQANRLEQANQQLAEDLAAVQLRQGLAQAQAARQASDPASPTYATALARLGDINANARSYTPAQVQTALADLAGIVQRLLRATAP